MDLADKERRRLDAEAFDILENEDGFRLQLLVETRNKANRSRRLLIDEMRRKNLINKARYQAIGARLKLDQIPNDSLILDQTLGEESFEDSMVDVAPVPGSVNRQTAASFSDRHTLVKGSKFERESRHPSSMDASDGSRSESSQLSLGDESSITMRPHINTFEGDTALIGAPHAKRKTEPDARSITAASIYPQNAQVASRPVTQQLNQIEALLQAFNNPTNQLLRLRLIAQHFAQIALVIEPSKLTEDEQNRWAEVCRVIAQGLPEADSFRWTQSLLAAMSSRASTLGRQKSMPIFNGQVRIDSDSTEGTVELYRLLLEDGWVHQHPIVTESRNDAENANGTPWRAVNLLEGWYQVVYKQSGLTARWQQFVPAGVGTALSFSESLTAQAPLVFIHPGHALLGDAANGTQSYPFDIYAVPGFYLSRRPVSFGEYFRFLSFIKRTQGAQSSNRRLPRTAPRGGYRWEKVDAADEGQVRSELGSTFDAPVTGISFHDARAYCHWLNIEVGPGHRMPSELEWEKALRGCLGTTWSWGEHWTEEQSLKPSPFGIMGGSFMEWTSSAAEDARYRVARGILVLDGAPPTNGFERHFLPEEQVSATVTFRVARSTD